MNVIYTIGHSNHSIEFLLDLLLSQRVSAVADVRSIPASRFAPHFSGRALQYALRKFEIAYAFLGLELGARSRNPACYREGVVQYELLSREPRFEQGLARLRRGMQTHRIALLCAEREPLECHRAVLVGRELHVAGSHVEHIHSDGSLEAHEALECRMLATHRIAEHDLFASREELIAEAYRRQAAAISYRDESMSEEPGE